VLASQDSFAMKYLQLLAETPLHALAHV
jgi:hypothetical protein